jgi:hypothetical protein
LTALDSATAMAPTQDFAREAAGFKHPLKLTPIGRDGAGRATPAPLFLVAQSPHSREMEAVMGRTREDAGSVDLPPRPPETKEVIESKLIPCERCGTVVAMLIFAPNATDAGHLEDYARKMYPHYNHLNVPTWIIGPALGEGPLIDRPADVLKVWPAREPIQRLPPAQFNSLLDQFVTRHCH